jgi:hypothetical protein
LLFKRINMMVATSKVNRIPVDQGRGVYASTGFVFPLGIGCTMVGKITDNQKEYENKPDHEITPEIMSFA